MSKKRRDSVQSKNPNERHRSGMPSRQYRYQDKRFREAGSSKLIGGTDGSSADIDFMLAPPAGQLWIVDYITLLMIDPGNMEPTDFGSLGAPLGNGLQVVEKINSVESVYTTIEDNADLAQCFFGGIPTPGGVVGADPGFLNSIDKALGRMPFDMPITLDGNDGDMLIIRNRDNLTAIQFMAASAHVKLER